VRFVSLNAALLQIVYVIKVPEKHLLIFSESRGIGRFSDCGASGQCDPVAEGDAKVQKLPDTHGIRELPKCGNVLPIVCYDDTASRQS